MLLLFSTAFGARAQQRPAPVFFQEDAAARSVAARSPLVAALRSSRSFTLDVPGLRAALGTAPPEGRAGGRPLVLVLPLPGGTNARFQVVQTVVMEPALAAQFPNIKTYSGVGVDDPSATVRLDLTQHGFHAQVLSAATGDFYIDPATRTDTQHYLSFWKRAMPGQPFSCGALSKGAGPGMAASTGGRLRTSGTVVRTFRLAVAATGEYTAFHGGTVALGQAAIVTSVNRVVGLYERELGVRMVLVNNNAALVYTNAAADPYTNGAPFSLISENQANLDAVIGTANYDIGQVFGTAGGGLAYVGVVCLAGYKAQGETSIPSPVGDAFDIAYVAHEMGHQFGAFHSFNSETNSCNGNRAGAYAYEPGSGSTIMGYAGLCNADNLQSQPDSYFHAGSYDAIQNYLGQPQGSCATLSATGNTLPTVVLPVGGKVLPISTPFKLTASGFDADGDALTYNWEEYDLGAGAALTDAQVAGQTIPLFRSFSPSASPTRYFPRLSDLVANTTTPGERLPTVSRPLNFRVTLRDEHNGAAGVVGGVNSSAVVALNSTSAAGPFLVTAPNTAVTWAGNSSQPVTWAVAGTDANGVNCATVNLRLSTDGGLTYPTLLLAGAPNNGAATVAVPNTPTTTARVLVEAADNYFFDISDANFTIELALTSTVWTGAVSTDWFAGANWTAGVPTTTQDAVIRPNSFSRQPVIVSGSATACYLAIDANASLTQRGGTLDVRGDWTNNGTFVATGGTVVFEGTVPANAPGPNIFGNAATRFWNLSVQTNGLRLGSAAGASVQRILTLAGSFATLSNLLTLESGPAGDALVVNGGGAVVGATTVQRFNNPSLNNGLGYRHYSSPVSNTTVVDLATSAFAPVLNPNYNTSATPAAETPFPTVFGYDEARVLLSNNVSGFGKGYFSPTALTDPLVAGRGYTVRIGASQTVDFVGSLNNGDVAVSLTNHRSANSDAGWHLVGNPYPSPLSYSLIAAADRQNLEGAMYVFSSLGPYSGQYRTWNNGIGNPIITSGQAFFVRVLAGASAGMLTFRNTQRLTVPGSATFQRAAETRPLVQLSLQPASSTAQDEAYVYFQAGATAGPDADYDAIKLPNPSGLNLSAQAGSQNMAINGLPPLGAAALTVPLTVRVPATGTYTLSAAQLLNLAGTFVYLHDLQLGTFTNLHQQPSYTFTLNAVNPTPRFELVFGAQQVLGTGAAAWASQVVVYPNPASAVYFIELPAALGRQPVAVSLVDALGRVVRQQALPAGLATHALSLTGLAAGVYSLQLNTEAGLLVKRLVVD